MEMAPSSVSTNKIALQTQGTVWEGGKGQAVDKDDDVFGTDSDDSDPIRVDAAEGLDSLIDENQMFEPNQIENTI